MVNSPTTSAATGAVFGATVACAAAGCVAAGVAVAVALAAGAVLAGDPGCVAVAMDEALFGACAAGIAPGAACVPHAVTSSTPTNTMNIRNIASFMSGLMEAFSRAFCTSYRRMNIMKNNPPNAPKHEQQLVQRCRNDKISGTLVPPGSGDFAGTGVPNSE